MTVKIEKWWLNQTEAAKSCGVTQKTFIGWNVPTVHEGKKEKYYVMEHVVANRVDKAIQTAKKNGGIDADEAREALHAAKLEETEARTENWNLKNAQLRRETAPIEALEFALGRAGSQIASALGNIPIMVKRRNISLTASDIDIINNEVIKCQNIATDIKLDMSEYDG